MPYWDVDFSWGFAGVINRSLFSVVWDWLSPFQQHVENWGATDRPAQFVVYKICYMIAGYNSWPYLLSRDLCFAGIVALIYLWSLRLCVATEDRWKAAAAAAVFFMLAPALPASMAFLGDFGPASEFVFLLLTYLLWWQVEHTPEAWTWITPLSP